MKWDYPWYKRRLFDKVWWKDMPGIDGDFIFSFDKKKEYNLFRDYPDALSERELAIFNKENRFWVDFFTPEEN